MSIFKRIFGIGKSEVNSALDKLEDPIKMTEQGIRDLKKDLQSSVEGLAQVKAISIRTRRELETHKNNARDYEQKAMLLLQRAESGEMDMAEAERLATECLNKKEQAESSYQTQANLLQKNEASEAQMEKNVHRLKSQISTWENELKTLKARSKVAEASKTLNKHLANVDSSSTVGMLERMKEKVDQQEALAESYGDMADASVSLDEEINKAVGPGSTSSSASLAALKAKMKLNQKNE